MYVLSATSIQIHWSPPKIQNGIIQNYTIYINDNAFINVSATSTIVEGFSPNEMVYQQPLGEGPTSEPVTVTTHESSKHLY